MTNEWQLLIKWYFSIFDKHLNRYMYFYKEFPILKAKSFRLIIQVTEYLPTYQFSVFQFSVNIKNNYNEIIN